MERFKADKKAILDEMSRKSKKHEAAAQDLAEITPMFFALGGDKKPFLLTSMQTQVRDLFKEVGVVNDFIMRKITPGSIRKSARMVAKLKGGYDDALLDAIGGWKQKSLPREFYEDFMVPKDATETILRVEDFKRVDPKSAEITGQPTFDEEVWIQESELEEQEVASDPEC